MIDVTVSSQSAPITLDWLQTQNKSVTELQKELSDPSQLEAFSKNCKVLSKAYCTKTHEVADQMWQQHKEKYIGGIGSEGKRWTYPFDDARTCKDLEGFFINASDIHINGQYYIASQAPLTSTYEDFWKMIIHKESETIVTLNMPEEDKDEPAPWPVEYWKKDCVKLGYHEPEKIEEIACFGDWAIHLSKIEVVAKEAVEATDKREKIECAIVRREFILENKKSNDKRTVRQFHFLNWPDFEGAPIDRLFHRLLELVEKAHASTKIPLTVHCAAGMGRAGSFIAAHALRSKIRQQLASGKKPEEVKVNLPETIYQMRQCRKDMVSRKGIPCIVGALNDPLRYKSLAAAFTHD